MPNEIVRKLKNLHKQLKEFKRNIKLQKTKTIGKKQIYNKAEEIGTSWFDEYTTDLSLQNLPEDIIEKYSEEFSHLIKLSTPSNLKKSYEKVLDILCGSFRDDLILPLQQSTTDNLILNQLNNILKNLPDTEQNDYLKETIACAQKGYRRAAAVLGWCVAIDQIHRVIKKIGFVKFNTTSGWMASQTAGRFKKFNKVQNVHSISELREVFDTIILWVLEGMQLIDSNEHTRLRGCFNLRCQCAHPGDAPITDPNLLSFFSDLNEIIFRNPKFSVSTDIT